MDVANVSNTYIESGTDSVNPFFFGGGGGEGGLKIKCVLWNYLKNISVDPLEYSVKSKYSSIVEFSFHSFTKEFFGEVIKDFSKAMDLEIYRFFS